jgi:tetratricopeptide (TPR) repeat protein
MGDYQTKYDLFYKEAINLLDKGGSVANVYEYIDSLQEEDYRDHVLMKMAKFFASQGRLEDALHFCSAIHEELEHADALFEVGRELRKNNSLDSAKDVFRQTVEAAERFKPSAWEMPAIFLQVSDELWNLNEKQRAMELLRRAIELAKQPPQPFEASKTLAGCARVLARWGNTSEAMEVAQAIASPEQRRTVLDELQKGSVHG